MKENIDIEGENFDNENDLLWKKFLDGDDESFNHLYSRNIQILFRYGLQFTFDRELVKDCIQDVFVKIYETKARHYHIKYILLYLRISLKNKIFNALKREKTHSEYLNEMEFSDIDDFTAEQEYEYREEEQQNRIRIEAIMKHLTPQQKKVVQYRYLDDISLEEISVLMKINYQSVQNILQRAIKKIKNHFF